jgi:Ca-activated chloride channel family protein
MPAADRTLSALALALALLSWPPAPAGSEEAPLDRTLSPYFFVEGGDPAVDRFPLASTQVEVAVSGVIADVRVSQVYQNAGARPIDARYVFPASTRAAVNGLRMKVRDEVIEAEIQEKQQARKTFAAAKEAGKNAGLLEQQRPNVFTMSVANLMPGDRIEVTLRYTELLVPSEGRYEFVFPTVVGPRYANEEAKGRDDDWVATPYLAEGEPPPATWSLSGAVATSLPIREIVSPSHALEGAFESPSLYRFALGRGEERGADRDFILAYRLAGEAIQSGLSLFAEGDEKFFQLLVEPPARVAESAIPPREFVFVVDVSGSMRGFPLDTAKELLRDLVTKLRPSDAFNVLLFSGGSRLLAPESLPATAENVAAALALLDGQHGGGGTELVPALERALVLSPEPGLARSFLVVTDGYVQADRHAIELVARHLGEANVFAFGIGSSVNRHLIEGLARAGRGEPFVVTEPGEAAARAERFAAYVRAPVLTDVRVEFEGFEAYAIEPRAIPDVLAARPVVVLGRWRGEPAGAIRVTGATGRGAFVERFEVASAVPRPENRALAQLWARERIAALLAHGLAEPGEEARGEILALGLGYRLLTPFTSFVAVSRVVRNPGAEATDVQQPLPLPKGVPASAVGVSLRVAPEPELELLVAALALVAAGRALWRARARRRRMATA